MWLADDAASVKALANSFLILIAALKHDGTSSGSTANAAPDAGNTTDDDDLVSLQVNKIVTLAAANKIIEVLKKDSNR